MIGALCGLAFLAGFLGGWTIVPVLAATAFMFALAHGRYVPIVLLVATALAAGSWRAPDDASVPVIPIDLTNSIVAGTISSEVVDDGRVQRFRLSVGEWTICARTFARTDLGRGDTVTAEVDVTVAAAMSDGYRQYLRSQGCGAAGSLGRITLVDQGSGIARSIDDVRQSVTRNLVSWVPGDEGALLAGLVIGDDNLMSDEATEAFAQTGTIHVVAVSGSNLALLASILLIANVLFARRFLAEATGISIIWGYVLLGGAVPPTLRAGMLATAAAGARLVGRPTDVLTLSVQVAAIQAALWPESTLGLSYRLSTVAIFGVVIAAAGRSFEGWLAGVRLVALTTIVVNVAMLPILPADSRPVLLVSLLTNIAIAPLIAASFSLGVLAVAVGWLIEPLGEALAVVAGEINGITLRIVTGLAEIESLPGPLDTNGGSAPGWFLVAFVVAFLACVSTEFRRWLRDLCRQPPTITDRTADVATGAAIGAVCAAVGVALLR